jgi:hypothetical protein
MILIIKSIIELLPIYLHKNMLSWISELDRLEKLSQNAMREPATYLPLTILYINKQNVVDSAVHKYMELKPHGHDGHDGHSNNSDIVITKERLLKLAAQHAKTTDHETKYICKELMLFHIPIEPEQVEYFSQHAGDRDSTDFCTKYTKTFVMIEDIVIEPSMFIFHSLNRLYMIFMECTDRSLPKSCMKKSSIDETTSFTGKIGKMTKRVRFKHSSSSSYKGKKTRKAI